MKHSALVKAVKHGDVIEVRRLLEDGADPNEGSPGFYTPLYVAAARGNTPMVLALLQAGAKPDWHAVQVAAFGNHAKTVRALLASGASADGPSGETPLLNALRWSGFRREQQTR